MASSFFPSQGPRRRLPAVLKGQHHLFHHFAYIILPLLFFAVPSFAQTNAVSGEEIPPLLPPRTEMPPSFGEQYGLWLILAGIFVLVLVCGAIWFLTRPKPARIIPPAVEARTALEPLRQQREDGAVLTRVSQVLRRYVAEAFGMPQEERTTAEFCQALARVEHVGPDLSKDVSRFLKECDIRKFAPAPASSTVPAVGAVPHAFKLIDQAEARLAQLRQAAAATPPVHERKSEARNPKAELK